MDANVVMSGVLASILGVGIASSQGIDQDEIQAVVVVAGPYEYLDGTGTIGYVVGNMGQDIVDFKPCLGVVKSVEFAKLKLLNDIGCESEPPRDRPRAVVSCDTVDKIAIAMVKTGGGDVGTVYSWDDANLVVHATQDVSQRQFSDAGGFAYQDCGRLDVVEFASDTFSWAGVVWKPGLEDLEQAPE